MIQKERVEELRERLGRVDWNKLHKIDPSDVDLQWNLFMKLFKTEFDNVCPLRKMNTPRKRNTKRSLPSSQKTSECKRRLDILHQCKQGNAIFTEAYKKTKEEYDGLLKMEKSQTFKNTIRSSDNKSKSL
ncbi:hypothetical protein HHI36_006486 [Cryptolaemus montrouzieri]|uniref:Uncharacterized protein n=1 Tax=Cryptolaemus montrouzieri TaxID=559131 RepID=A0ABD2NXC5_9CUCU